MSRILYFDLEINPTTAKIEQIGFVLEQQECLGCSLQKLIQASENVDYICGHNIKDHDLKALADFPGSEPILNLPVIDTLVLSPLLRPNLKSHALDKDYQKSTTWKNNPLLDSKLAKKLLLDLINCFFAYSSSKQHLLRSLLTHEKDFKPFFQLIGNNKSIRNDSELIKLIKSSFPSKLCHNADLPQLLAQERVELAYLLSLIDSEDPRLPTPSWLLSRYPRVQSVFTQLRSNNCGNQDCSYCKKNLDPKSNLKSFFEYDDFRRFEGDGFVPLQEQVVHSALQNESFLAIFPTGGGKSLTFQLPALMRGKASGALTVVISPLVALMKDQVDVLRRKDIVNAVSISGLLSPLERAEAIQKVQDGTVNLLYIAPESLRSNTILNLMIHRMIDRFVIDEAHCFSAWGQDFRVDYLYIPQFIRQLQNKKNLPSSIPVSCFTATARPEVVTDIRSYFQTKLGLEIKLFQTHQQRLNLSFQALEASDDRQKINKLLLLLDEIEGPAIVYVNRVKKTATISDELRKNGVNAAPYNGKMENRAKNQVQDDFASGEIQVIVATSAFGMGVDKDNVGLVVHFDISNSLENYVQESGRAGRDPKMQAKCVILFNENDLNKHFSLLQNTKLNKKEISQIWQGIKRFHKEHISKSALEIAKSAGWDEEMMDLDTRVKIAINALENAGYLQREMNSPRVFASGLIPDNFEQASNIARQNSFRFTPKQQEVYLRVLQYIYGKEEVRVDYMADQLGVHKSDLVTILNLFKEIEILGDEQDLTAALNLLRSPKNSNNAFNNASELENKLLEWLQENYTGTKFKLDLREANHEIQEKGVRSNIPLIRNLLRYWEWKGYLTKERVSHSGTYVYNINFRKSLESIATEAKNRSVWARRILNSMLELAESPKAKGETKAKIIEFSVASLKKKLEATDLLKRTASISQYQEYLLYLHSVEALDLKDGLLVFYNRLNIHRKEHDSRKQYTKDDYRQLKLYYEKKVEQVHIVGEYVNRLLTNYRSALRFTNDYFRLPYNAFLRKYFPHRRKEIGKALTKKRYTEIFGQLSLEQIAPVKDTSSHRILVAAGPGSGKTRVLVHKMASLLLIEDIKPEQFLMLTFSRPAANEFRDRLRELVPDLAHYVDISTYHSFAFNLVGRRGDLQKSKDIIKIATQEIRDRNIPLEKVAAKSVVVLDEFQDVSKEEYDFLEAILDLANDIRVIAAGDDDQSIYEFRGASVKYMHQLIKVEDGENEKTGATYFLSTNYRSRKNLVDFSNQFLQLLPQTKRVKSDKLLIAHQKELGSINLVHYRSGNLLEPMVQAILKDKLEGTTAILTHTNDEALQAATLLKQKGIPAMLITSQPGFQLRFLVELQAFTDLIFHQIKTEFGFIPNPHWMEAKELLKGKFKTSRNLDLTLKILSSFETEFERKHKGEWLEYMDTLKIEDFYFPEQDKVLVSTMHKSKGKEFDQVFLLLDNNQNLTDEEKRVIYVAITRAKSHLEIHTKQNCFNRIQCQNLNREQGIGSKNLPQRIQLQTGLKDLNLNFFKKYLLHFSHSGLRAGDQLTLENPLYPTLYSPSSKKVGQFSKSFQTRMDGYFNKGYEIESIEIENIVCWKAPDAEEAVWVILPLIQLKIKNSRKNN